MLERKLLRELTQVGDRYRSVRLSLSLALVWLVASVAAACMLWLNRSVGWYAPAALPVWGTSVLVAAAFCFFAVQRTARQPLWLARRIEAQDPQLKQRLLAAVEQSADQPDGRLGFLQESVVQEALVYNRRHPWVQSVPTGRLALTRLASLLSLLLLIGSGAILLDRYSPPRESGSVPTTDPGLQMVGNQYRVAIEPGDTEVERGTSLLVSARFAGSLPTATALVTRDSDGKTSRIEMARSLDDPLFVARIPAVRDDLVYHVEIDTDRTDTFQVTVFEHPQLIRMDAQLEFPAYTSKEDSLVQDTRRISAVEGTKVTLLCQLNKPVTSATLDGRDDHSILLQADPQQENVYQVQLTLDQSRRFLLRLKDEQQRENKTPPEIIINAIPNQTPDMKLAWPARDLEVSPLEEVTLKMSVWDDFGVNLYGLSYTIAGQTPKEIVLGKDASGHERRGIETILAMEDLQAEVDHLVSYHFWAEDVGPDGQPRRSFTDMYFAEVRPFDEIFRQGEQPPGGSQQQQQQQQQQGGNAEQAAQLGELQKQIINGTWKLVRRESRGSLTDNFTSDTNVLLESQQDALAQAAALAEQLQDDQSKKQIDLVTSHMNESIKQLTSAAGGPDPDALSSALAAQQQAYQALLRLRAREHEVIQSQQQSQQQQNSQSASQRQNRRSQQQLQQLQLDNSENRYEEQRAATPPKEESAERETRQALNRLRELAQRQGDLNKQLKELQSALEEAETEEQRDEIRQRLKRLREEQERILRDTDELQDRMEREENQQSMAESREQLQQTRENVRRASGALEEGQVSQALTAGTRAERELQNLRDDFRKEAAGHFDEEMKAIRDDAQELDQKQQELAQQLENLDQPDPSPSDREPRSLRDAGERGRIEQRLQQQGENLEKLLDQMQEVVQEAEEPEPLLAQNLYDTLRKARRDQLDDRLNVTQELLRRGFVQPARDAEKEARQGIGELREGIEDAAESVLGSETEALARAESELRRLADQLGRELDEADPQNTQPRSANSETPPRPGQESGQARPETQPENPGQRGSQPPNSDNPNSPQPNSQPAGNSPPNPSPAQSSDPPREPSPGDQPTPSGQPGQAGQQPGQPQPGQQQQRGARQPGQPNRSDDSPRPNDPNGFGGLERQFSEEFQQARPLTGDSFLDWSDRLRDVEEMLDDNELRAEAARIRDRASGVRSDLKRHGKEPNWDLVRTSIFEPLHELRDLVADELRRRTTDDTLSPIDRDPVPDRFSEPVRKYYEKLGAGQ